MESRTTTAILITTITIIEALMQPMGTFWGVGVGPGDPELLTLKAVRVLREVDWIFCPAESGQGASFAARIVAPLGLPADKFRPVSLCMSRQRDAALQAYRQAAEEIRAELRQGRSAAWITEGDPLFYSSFSEIAEEVHRLCHEVRIEVVPGVSSVQAAAARVGVPLAHRDEALAVLPAAYGLDRLPLLLDSCATVALLKVNSVFDSLLARLVEIPQPLQMVYVEKVGTTEERMITDLLSLRGEKLPYFSLVLLRRRSQEVGWAESSRPTTPPLVGLEDSAHPMGEAAKEIEP